MTPLRILHVTPYFEHAWAYGGIPRVVTTMARALARRGHDVTVCTTDVATADGRLAAGTPDDLPLATASPIRVRVFRNVSNWAAYRWQAFLPIGFRRFLQAHLDDFDVVHLHACHNVLSAVAARACCESHVPFLVSPHGTAPRLERRRAAKWIFERTLGRNILANASLVAAVSGAEERQLLRLGVAHDRIVTVPNPIDLETFDDRPPRGGFRSTHDMGNDPIVMFLGKLTPRKRVDVLVQAFAYLKSPQARLVIAGNDMGVAHALGRQVNRLGLTDRVTFTGLLSGRERVAALVDADAVVYASTDEVFGLVPLEALLCGTPVVVSNDSGCGEVIQRVGGGIAVPPRDPVALAGALGRVLGAPGEWRTAAESAAARVRTLFAPAVTAADLEAVYLRMSHRTSVAAETRRNRVTVTPV